MTTQRLIAYLRVSKDEQLNGVSMEVQEGRIRAYCTAQDKQLVAVQRDEGVSGKIHPRQRPALARALEAVESGRADGIVALRLDRLSRTTRGVLDLADAADQRGWILVSVQESFDTSTPFGRFGLTLMGALAQLEREQIGDRVQKALAHIAREGRGRSRFTPFGWRTHEGETEQRKGCRGKLVPHEGEQATLARIQELRAAGAGARKIARALDQQGVPTRRGAPWTPSSVASILRTLARRERDDVSHPYHRVPSFRVGYTESLSEEPQA